MKNFFLIIARFYLRYLNRSDRIRDFLLWPVTSRIFGRNYVTTITLKNGLRLKIDLGDMLGRTALFYGPFLEYFWEPQTLRLVKILARSGGRALVAGAHIGYSALAVAKCLERGAVLALEPVKYLYETARENFALNSTLGKLYLEHAALSDRDGEAEIYVENLRSTLLGADKVKSASPERETVVTKTVPTLLAEHGWHSLDLLLLDVEGYEFKVLEGMRPLFERGILPDIIFEYNPPQKSGMEELSRIVAYLAVFGYRLYIIEDNYELRGRLDGGFPVELYSWPECRKRFAGERSFNVLAVKDAARLDVGDIKIVS